MNAATLGTFTCPTDAQTFTIGGKLEVFCDVTVDGNPNAQTTLASLSLAGYHGTDTYTFQGTADANGSLFGLTIGNTSLDAIGPNPPEPATSCTVTLTGPATLGAGAEVKGHVHCDGMAGQPLVGSGRYAPPTYVTVDGDFDVVAR